MEVKVINYGFGKMPQLARSPPSQHRRSLQATSTTTNRSRSFTPTTSTTRSRIRKSLPTTSLTRNRSQRSLLTTFPGSVGGTRQRPRPLYPIYNRSNPRSKHRGRTNLVPLYSS